MYSIDSLLHQVSQAPGGGGPSQELGLYLWGPSLSQEHESLRAGLGILHQTVEHSQILHRVATGQEAEDSQADPSSPTLFPSEPLSTGGQLPGTNSCRHSRRGSGEALLTGLLPSPWTPTG